jgi:hypothetical protein
MRPMSAMDGLIDARIPRVHRVRARRCRAGHAGGGLGSADTFGAEGTVNRASARCVMLAGALVLSPAGLHAADKPGGLGDLQQSIQRSTAELRDQATRAQAAQAQQRAETAGSGGIGVQVVNPGPPSPLAPTTPTHCVTRYTGANVFVDCR